MRASRLVVAAACMALLCAALATPAALAAYSNGAEIMSASTVRKEQGDEASDAAAVSRDGRYVAFQTRAGNFFADDDPDPPDRFRVGGIFRRDIASGALELVADGDFRSETDSSLLVRGARNPSISADGRFVAFSTAQRLVPQDQNGNVDVYVRDMAVATRSSGAFDLVSAKDGGDLAASYAASPAPRPGLDPGSEIAPAAGISGDGRTVVFRSVNLASDLPNRPTPDTPPFQVLVRDREANRTTLITKNKDTREPAGGAAGPAGISADGTTVIWTGQNAPLQTRFLDGELSGSELTDNQDPYYLWRRIADGENAPTRRITGVSDPDACPTGSVAREPTADGPCYGPLTDPERFGGNLLSLLPALSADGYRVAFLTAAGPRPNNATGNTLDLWLTDMSPGVTRREGSVELTREAPSFGVAGRSPINTVGMSADGRHVAIGTVRTRFTLPRVTLTGSPRQAPDVQELYVIDLPPGPFRQQSTATIERATKSFTGGEVDASLAEATPTLSDDGARVAVVSFASNLFFGDANERPDAFLLMRAPESTPEQPRPPVDQPVDPPGDTPVDPPAEERPFSVSARRGKAGTVVLLAKVPGAGRVRAVARVSTKRRRGKPLQRTVATATVQPTGRSDARLTLRLGRRDRTELKRRGRLVGQATVTFQPSSAEKAQTKKLKVTFRAARGGAK